MIFRVHKLLAGLLLLCVCCMAAGCANSGRRNRANRDGGRHKTEQESQRHRHSEDPDNDYAVANDAAVSSDQLAGLSASDDYDGMLDALQGALRRIKSLRNLYFKGGLSDKEFKRRLDEIQDAYAPVLESLQKASSEGNLNYRQHKRQMKLMVEYMKIMAESVSKISGDFESMF